MVRLIGVYHGGEMRNAITGETICESNFPGRQLIETISKLPKGTRIGLELCNEEEWDSVNKNLYDLQAGSEWDEKIFYEKGGRSDVYWKDIVRICHDSGHHIIYLDRPEVWFRHNEACIRAYKIKKTGMEIDGRETELDSFLKQCKHDDDIHGSIIQMRYIHEIERDDAILQSIAEKKPDVVISGTGHTDFWVANPDILKTKYGIVLNGYSTEKLERDGFTLIHVFSENSIPDPQQVFSRIGLERAMKFIQEGRITDGKPYFVGTWDLACPSKGFFELFVEKTEDDGFMTGTIEDFLGTADFECASEDGRFDFSKRYRPSQCDKEALNDWIEYQSEGEPDSGYHGIFKAHFFNVAFFMRKPSGNGREDPLDMSKVWYEKHLQKKAGQQFEL